MSCLLANCVALRALPSATLPLLRAIRQPVVAAIATVSEPHLFAPRALQTLNRAAIKASMSEDDDDDFSAFGQVGAAATATKMPDLGAADDDDEFR
jgi:hypothetical protein